MPGRVSSLLFPIPYRGGKRKLAPSILSYVPSCGATLYEPFVGSGAVSIGVAATHKARRFVLGDSFGPLVGIWQQILARPGQLADDYERIWEAQLADPRGYYDRIRDAFNQGQDPALLLYLLTRCVKNAVRFNAQGRFNQSPDRRRLGMRPALLRARVLEVHALLQGRATAICADYAQSLRQAEPVDLVYMDPPHLGVSGARDARYHQGLDYDRFVAELERANGRGVSYIVSFDGRCGDCQYGLALPEALNLRRVELQAGRSSQATLNGRADETVESLYLSPALLARLPNGALP